MIDCENAQSIAPNRLKLRIRVRAALAPIALVTFCPVDILPALKCEDSSCETPMSERENIHCSVHIAVVDRSARAASPLSYSKTCSTFRTAGRIAPTARTSLGCKGLIDLFKDDTGLMALVFQHRLQ